MNHPHDLRARSRTTGSKLVRTLGSVGDRMNGICAVDLFCGAGGLTRGLKNAGINVRLGVDVDPACEFPYSFNNRTRFLLKPIQQLDSKEIAQAWRGARFSLLAGCAPCQPFSLYSQGKTDEIDGRWNLLAEFQRLVLRTKPTLVTMENVPRLAEQSIFSDFVTALKAAKYHVCFQIVKSADYGVPQQRERLVLLASRLGPVTLIPPTHAKTLAQSGKPSASMTATS